MSTVTDPGVEARVRTAARDTFPWYATNFLHVANNQQFVPFKLRPAQQRLWDALAAQRAEGRPMRAIILKARKMGFCLDPSTRVLTADLRWVTLDEIQPGQEIVCTDEEIPGGRGAARKMRRGVVEAKAEVFEPAFRLTMDDGRELVATAQHRFLSRRRGGTDTVWRTVDFMKPGDVIRYVTSPWEGESADDGWMGGILDGEGCLQESGSVSVAITQRPGPVYDKARAYLAERGYSFREEVDKRPATENGKFKGSTIGKLVIGRMNEVFRLIGQTRPVRFENGGWWEDRDLPGKRSANAWSQIVAIEALPGARRMIDLQTSHKTFIAEGFVSHNSTMAQGLMLQRATQRPNHNCLVVAQDNDTAQELFRIGEQMYGKLPNEPELAWCKPEIVWTRRGREMHFGEANRNARTRGDLGLNSKILVDTASSFEAGRGFTYHTLHLSEVAFWPDAKTKLTALFNTVPQDDPDTLVLIESTANGFNYFQTLWENAEKGLSDYHPFFAAWFEDPRYRRPFPDETAMEQFAEEVGRGPWGQDEPDLLKTLTAEFDRTTALEALQWRRWAIENLAHSDLDTFRQEYPSFPEEAFLQSGRTVFAANHLRKIREISKRTEPTASRLWLDADGHTTRQIRAGTIQVPKGVKTRDWRETDRGDGYWRVWTKPDEGTGHYVIVLDPAAGTENTVGESDYSGIQVIDHKTREQCAEFQSHDAPAQVAEQLFLCALWYRVERNLPLVVVEVTGGYGNWPALRVWREYGWRNMYFRKALDPRARELQTDLVGFMTDRGSKPLLEDTAREVLAQEDPGIRSTRLALEAGSYVRDAKGKTGAQDGKHDDLLMPWMIAQFVAGVKPPRERRAGGVISTANYRTT